MSQLSRTKVLLGVNTQIEFWSCQINEIMLVMAMKVLQDEVWEDKIKYVFWAQED